MVEGGRRGSTHVGFRQWTGIMSNVNNVLGAYRGFIRTRRQYYLDSVGYSVT